MTRDQVLPVTPAHRNEPGDRSATVSDLDLFALRDQGQVAAGMLAQLADADAVHVLHRSTTVGMGEGPVPDEGTAYSRFGRIRSVPPKIPCVRGGTHPPADPPSSVPPL